MNTRDRIIKYGLDNDISISKINNVLSRQGYNKYNPLTSGENWANIIPNIGKNVKEISTALPTIAGAVGGYVLNEGTRNTINKKLQELGPVGTLGKAIDYGILSTYNTSLDKLSKGQTSSYDIAQGIMEDPLFAGLDILSLGAAKPLAKGSKALAETISKSERTPQLIKKILPSDEANKINDIITRSAIDTGADFSKYQDAIKQSNLLPNVDMKQVSKNIHLGTKLGNDNTVKVTDEFLKLGKALEGIAVENRFLDPLTSKNNTIAQYVLAKNPKSGLIHDDIMIYLSNGIGDLKPEILKSIEEGSKLYDKGKITFVSQAVLPSKLEGINASDIANLRKSELGTHGYFGTPRVLGLQDIERMGKVLPESFSHVEKQLEQAKGLTTVLDNLLESTGSKVGSLEEAMTAIRSGDKLVSPQALKENIARNFMAGDKSLKNIVSESINIKDAKTIANSLDSLYKLDDMTLNALMNSIPKKSGFLGNLNSFFKKTQLSTLKWYAENRIGNLYNNIVEGVTKADYADAKKYRGYEPKQMVKLTSFSGYVGDTGQRIGSTFSGSKLGLKDIKLGLETGNSSKIVNGIADVFTSPIIRIESKAELADRFANYIRQVKRYSEQNNLNWKEVLKKSKDDKKLFWELYEPVNKSLGDYVGKNYQLSKEVYDIIGLTMPFYKFPKETAKIFGHQLANKPLALNLTTNIPAKIGNEINKEQIKEFGLDPDKFKGGVYMGGKEPMKFIGSRSLPPSALADMLTSLSGGGSEALGLLSPLLSVPHNVLMMEGYGGRSATSPNFIQLSDGRRYPIDNKGNIISGKEYDVTTKDRSAYALNQLANLFLTPYVQYTRMLEKPTYATKITREALSSGIDPAELLKAKPYRRGYDTNPFRTNEYAPALDTFAELLGPVVGLNVNKQYKPYLPNAKKVRSLQKQTNRKYKRENR